MDSQPTRNIFDLPELRDRQSVFEDRIHAGKVLAGMLESFRGTDTLVLGIPAGGVPVAATVSRLLGLSFDVAVVSKITLPWNTEAGYGAIAFDGTRRMNDEMMLHIGLSQEQIQEGIEKTRLKVRNRVKKLRGGRPEPDLSVRSTVLIDDGLASGFTMRVAVEAIRKKGADHLIVAVPTGHRNSVEAISNAVDALYCPNIRGGWRFAVASAYERWSDVDEPEVMRILDEMGITEVSK
jgi:predicted phosphoribosyltransferase